MGAYRLCPCFDIDLDAAVSTALEVLVDALAGLFVGCPKFFSGRCRKALASGGAFSQADKGTGREIGGGLDSEFDERA